MHEVLVNRLGGLSLPRKSVVRLTDRPDMTLDVYRGRKTTIQYNIYRLIVPVSCTVDSDNTSRIIYHIAPMEILCSPSFKESVLMRGHKTCHMKRIFPEILYDSDRWNIKFVYQVMMFLLSFH